MGTSAVFAVASVIDFVHRESSRVVTFQAEWQESVLPCCPNPVLGTDVPHAYDRRVRRCSAPPRAHSTARGDAADHMRRVAVLLAERTGRCAFVPPTHGVRMPVPEQHARAFTCARASHPQSARPTVATPRSSTLRKDSPCVASAMRMQWACAFHTGGVVPQEHATNGSATAAQPDGEQAAATVVPRESWQCGVRMGYLIQLRNELKVGRNPTFTPGTKP